MRSSRHKYSAAYTHGQDLRKLIHLAEYVSIVTEKEGFIIPIGVLLCDGGLDENPRFRRNLDAAIHNFKIFDLDALLICTLAPGMSAYYHVEQRMVPLSKAISGVLLPRDTCGSHLDSSRRTTEFELEKCNFQVAGEILLEIWGGLMLDDFPVFCEYIKMPLSNQPQLMRSGLQATAGSLNISCRL